MSTCQNEIDPHVFHFIWPKMCGGGMALILDYDKKKIKKEKNEC